MGLLTDWVPDDPASQQGLLMLASGLMAGRPAQGIAGFADVTSPMNRAKLELAKAQAADITQQVGLRNLQWQQQMQQWKLMQPIMERVAQAYGGSPAAPASPAAVPASLGSPAPGGAPASLGAPTGAPAASGLSAASTPTPVGGSMPSGGIGGIPLDQAGLTLALGGPAKLADAITSYNTPTDFIKSMRAAGIPEGSQQWNDNLMGFIGKQQAIAGRAGAPIFNGNGGIMAMAPKIPDNAIPQIVGGKVVGVTLLPGGAQIEQTNAYAQSAGKAQTKPITGYRNGVPVFTNELSAAQQGDPFQNLPPAQSGVNGAFVGNPADAIEGISKITDPQQRSNAYAALVAQLRSGNGSLPAASSSVLSPGLTPTQQSQNTLGQQYYDTSTKDRQAVPMLRQTLDEMMHLASNPNNTFGPGTPEVARLKALANNVGIDLTGAQTAQDVMGKLAANIVMTQLGQGGQTGTDAQMNQIIHSTPSGQMTNAAIKQVIPLLSQQIDVRDARANVAEKAVQSGGVGAVPSTINQFNKLASPPVVQLGMQLAQASKNGTVAKFMQSLTPQQKMMLPAVRQLDQIGAF